MPRERQLKELLQLAEQQMHQRTVQPGKRIVNSFFFLKNQVPLVPSVGSFWGSFLPTYSFRVNIWHYLGKANIFNPKIFCSYTISNFDPNRRYMLKKTPKRSQTMLHLFRIQIIFYFFRIRKDIAKFNKSKLKHNTVLKRGLRELVPSSLTNKLFYPQNALNSNVSNILT